jgi:hypothetical protein
MDLVLFLFLFFPKFKIGAPSTQWLDQELELKLAKN